MYIIVSQDFTLRLSFALFPAFEMFAGITRQTIAASSLLMAMLVFALCMPVYSQDNGIPDTVYIEGDSLFTGRSAPLRVLVTNDFPIKTIAFGLVTMALDSGFARLDSIIWAGRMADSSVLSFRISGSREGDGNSPDSLVLSAFKAGLDQQPLPVGSGTVAELWMTGLIPGQMIVDSGFMPPGGEFVMIPFTGDFTGLQFAPQFVNGAIQVVKGAGTVCGNIDNDFNGLVDIADLTALIDFLFINFTVPPGLNASNVDGSVDGKVDIADLTFLIDHLFINFIPLACK